MKSRRVRKNQRNGSRQRRLYIIKPYHALPCACEVFKVKGKEADQGDFGEGYAEDHEDYCCVGHYFHPYSVDKVSNEILEKYDITPDEFEEIASALEDELAVGDCGWCS